MSLNFIKNNTWEIIFAIFLITLFSVIAVSVNDSFIRSARNESANEYIKLSAIESQMYEQAKLNYIGNYGNQYQKEQVELLQIEQLMYDRANKIIYEK